MGKRSPLSAHAQHLTLAKILRRRRRLDKHTLQRRTPVRAAPAREAISRKQSPMRIRTFLRRFGKATVLVMALSIPANVSEPLRVHEPLPHSMRVAAPTKWGGLHHILTTHGSFSDGLKVVERLKEFQKRDKIGVILFEALNTSEELDTFVQLLDALRVEYQRATKSITDPVLKHQIALNIAQKLKFAFEAPIIAFSMENDIVMRPMEYNSVRDVIKLNSAMNSFSVHYYAAFTVPAVERALYEIEKSLIELDVVNRFRHQKIIEQVESLGEKYPGKKAVAVVGSAHEDLVRIQGGTFDYFDTMVDFGTYFLGNSQLPPKERAQKLFLIELAQGKTKYLSSSDQHDVLRRIASLPISEVKRLLSKMSGKSLPECSTLLMQEFLPPHLRGLNRNPWTFTPSETVREYRSGGGIPALSLGGTVTVTGGKRFDAPSDKK